MSDSTVLDLGRLDLHLANENISLRLSSEATLITSEKDGNSNAHACGLIQDLFTDDASRRPWVRKGHDYRVIIDIETLPELDIEDQNLAQIVTEKLRSSKVRASKV